MGSVGSSFATQHSGSNDTESGEMMDPQRMSNSTGFCTAAAVSAANGGGDEDSGGARKMVRIADYPSQTREGGDVDRADSCGTSAQYCRSNVAEKRRRVWFSDGVASAGAGAGELSSFVKGDQWSPADASGCEQQLETRHLVAGQTTRKSEELKPFGPSMASTEGHPDNAVIATHHKSRCCGSEPRTADVVSQFESHAAVSTNCDNDKVAQDSIRSQSDGSNSDGNSAQSHTPTESDEAHPYDNDVQVDSTAESLAGRSSFSDRNPVLFSTPPKLSLFRSPSSSDSPASRRRAYRNSPRWRRRRSTGGSTTKIVPAGGGVADVSSDSATNDKTHLRRDVQPRMCIGQTDTLNISSDPTAENRGLAAVPAPTPSEDSSTCEDRDDYGPGSSSTGNSVQGDHELSGGGGCIGLPKSPRRMHWKGALTDQRRSKVPVRVLTPAGKSARRCKGFRHNAVFKDTPLSRDVRRDRISISSAVPSRGIAQSEIIQEKLRDLERREAILEHQSKLCMSIGQLALKWRQDGFEAEAEGATDGWSEIQRHNEFLSTVITKLITEVAELEARVAQLTRREQQQQQLGDT